jgi:molybdate transport system ATP-binding protein
MLQVQVRRRLGAFSLDVSFTVQANEILAVHGPSGSGKTTLINLLAGLERPDSGRIVIDDRVLFDSSGGVDVKPEARRIGYVFQDCRLFPHMSVASNLRYGRHRWGSSAEFDQVVALLDLQALLGRRPLSLSGGEKQRVAIGRALLSGPQILLLDEPLASIDQQRKEEILPFIRRLRDEFDLPIVYVTHAPDEIAKIAERTIRIENGRLCEHDRLDGFGTPTPAETWMQLIAVVRHSDEETGMTILTSSLGRLLVPRRSEPPGTLVRVSVAARKVDPIASTEADDITILPLPPVANLGT